MVLFVIYNIKLYSDWIIVNMTCYDSNTDYNTVPVSGKVIIFFKI